MIDETVRTDEETVKTDMVTRMGWTLVVGMALLTAAPLAAQSQRMNFFVAVTGPSYGANRPPVGVSDAFCFDEAYGEGFGALTWRAYLTGTDTEAGQVARQRIGTGPWYNYAGDEIAANLDQLHSDGNNLTQESALSVRGQRAPEGVLELPPGSQLDGTDFTREGPFFCFGYP